MEPTRESYHADLITVVYAWADNDATADELLGAIVLHQQAIASLPPTPTPHRSSERIGLERGAVGVSLAERRACWTCRFARSLSSCIHGWTPEIDEWLKSDTDDNYEPLPTARNCPGYEDKP